jgi:hypothetical protein
MTWKKKRCQSKCLGGLAETDESVRVQLVDALLGSAALEVGAFALTGFATLLDVPARR